MLCRLAGELITPTPTGQHCEMRAKCPWPQFTLCSPRAKMLATQSIIVLLLLSATPLLVLADLAADAKILEQCMREVSNPERIDSDLQKLERYSDWVDEEVPCLLRCLAEARGWFDIESNSWHKQLLVDELGADVYNYCRYELDRKQRDGCTYAYRGLRCLKQAESNAVASYTSLLQCARQLNASNVELLSYSKLEPKENIPCLFQCFAKEMRFYDESGNWLLDNWFKAFGPTKLEQPADYSVCRSSNEQRAQQPENCVWMYEEYLCWERVNGNLIVVEPTDSSTTTA